MPVAARLHIIDRSTDKSVFLPRFSLKLAQEVSPKYVQQKQQRQLSLCEQVTRKTTVQNRYKSVPQMQSAEHVQRVRQLLRASS